MNWKYLKYFSFVDTRAKFVKSTCMNGHLLDIGSSDGKTLYHFHELRPDIHYYATDIEGNPENYPPGIAFYRGDIQSTILPWNDNSMDCITCMHLLEHLSDSTNLLKEANRVLKKGGKIYFETPHPRTLILSSPSNQKAGTFTINFYDDATHTHPVVIGQFASLCRKYGLEVKKTGVSRNLLFAVLYPLFFFFLPDSRMKFVCYIHFIGWSSYLICEKE